MFARQPLHSLMSHLTKFGLPSTTELLKQLWKSRQSLWSKINPTLNTLSLKAAHPRTIPSATWTVSVRAWYAFLGSRLALDTTSATFVEANTKALSDQLKRRSDLSNYLKVEALQLFGPKPKKSALHSNKLTALLSRNSCLNSSQQ